MYLKALEIQGFKSFPDKTVLTFEEDVTAIVGPNGSGKSNISDAIRWVMGEQSTRALRGGKMEDVIFGGTARRKQQGFAEVSLRLDNTDGLFPMDETEITVTRRYYRSGESEYFINRHSMRLKDVNELFMDTGLGREGYATIGQGKIDEILSVKSADRREVFEEAAGISRYRHRKEEAEHKLTRTEENLVRIGDKIDELALQVEPLRIQSAKARRFLLLRDELRGLEISLWLEQLERIRASAIKIQSDYDHAVRQREEAQTAVEALYAASEKISTQMREKDMEVEQLRFDVMRCQADTNRLESDVAVLKNNMQNNLENENRVRRELDQQEGRAVTLDTQIEERRTRLTELLSESLCLQAKLEQCAHTSEVFTRTAGELDDDLDRLRHQEAVETASASEARSLLSALATAAQEVMDREEALRRDLASGEEHLAAVGNEHTQAESALQETREGRDALKNIISGHNLRLETRRKKVTQAEERHRSLQIEESTLKSRIHMLSEMEKLYEGYSKAVKLIMGEAGRQLKGIRGPVAGLLHAPDRYAVAIETALGGAMQHLVVDTEEDGKAAITYLKRRDGGRATFLPITSIRPTSFQEKGVETAPGFVGMGDKLAQFDGRYRRVFSNLLGRVVVAEDLDSAIAMARTYSYRFRIVTLDGQVLNPGGSMTGGSTSKSAGILSRANELERLNMQLKTLNSDLTASARVLEECQRETTAAAYELETATIQQRSHEDEILRLDERTARLALQKRDLEIRREQLRSELEQLTSRAAHTAEDTRRARDRIETLEGAAAAIRAEAESKEQGRASIRDRAAQLGAEMAGVNVRLAALDAERLAAEQSIRELASLRQDITGDRTERERLIADYQAENQRLTAEIVSKETSLQHIRGENEERRLAADRLGEEKLTLEGKRNQADKESRDKNIELLNLEREAFLLEQRKNTATMEEKQLLDKLWETYELSHQAALAQRVPIESTPQTVRRIADLKREIGKLGNINLDAIEEFRRINERYTYLTDQRDDVCRAKNDLQTIISEITGEMKRIFSREFSTINHAFGETFVELFGGGSARLELEDESDILNCGIEIKVQPPGKALKILSLLSGGEKAFVAIALYFAILKVRPTPFCVMDEIEAALDDTNVTRFARFLRGMSGRTQFVVITHRRGTMEEADALYGVTMQEQGISRILTISLNDVEKQLHVKL